MAKILLSLLIAFYAGPTMAGGNPDLQLRLSGGAFQTDSTLSSTVTLDNNFNSFALGWSFGVCHDHSELLLTHVEQGSTTMTVNGGNAPDFINQNLYADGYTQAVAISFSSMNFLAPGLGYELAVGHYINLQEFPHSTSLNFCDSLGTPITETVISYSGAPIVPQTTGALIETLDPGHFIMRASIETAGYHPVTGASLGNPMATVSLQGNELTGGDSLVTSGFSFALSHDPNYLSAISVNTAGIVAGIDGGGGPGFLTTEIFPDGVIMGTVFDFGTTYLLIFDREEAIATVEYSINSSTLAATNASVETPLTWNESLGIPPVVNNVVSGGYAHTPELVSGAIRIRATYDSPFIRGDCNTDNSVDLADGVWAIEELFSGGISSNCLEACDANSDSLYDLSDAIFIFSFRFLNGPAPSAPYPNCGQGIGVGCEISTCP